LFFRDSVVTLISWTSTVFVVDQPTRSASSVWLKDLRSGFLALFGEPDSVRLRSAPDPNGSGVAVWAPGLNRTWGFVVCLEPVQSTDRDGSKAASLFMVDVRFATADEYDPVCYSIVDNRPWSEQRAAQLAHAPAGRASLRRGAARLMLPSSMRRPADAQRGRR
jgi:hypothetical protein